MKLYVFSGTALWPGGVLPNVAVVLDRKLKIAKGKLVSKGMDPELIDLALVTVRDAPDMPSGIVYTSDIGVLSF